MSQRTDLLKEIVDQKELNDIRGGSWIDQLRDWYYKYGPKCGSAGLIGIGTSAWVGKMTAYAINHKAPKPPAGTCGTCICH